MRLSRIPPAFSLCFAAYALPLLALAQQAPGKTAPPPPTMEKLEEGEPPAVTIRPAPNKPAITEKRAIGGKRTEVKVTTGKSTYTVKPNDPPGSAQPGDALSSQSRPAQWQVLTFDINRPQKEQQEQAAQAVPAPPPAKPATAAAPTKNK